MVSVYEKAREIKGKKGGPKLRLATFSNMITRQGNGVWMDAHELLRKDIHSMLDKQAEGLKKSATEFFQGIADKFNMMCADDGEETEEEAELRSKMAKNLVLVEEIMEKELLPAAKKFFEETE